MKRLIYLDNNATTPLHPQVKEVIIEAMELYGNPSSMHSFGRSSKEPINEARNKIANFLGATPEEIIFTASGSESDNTVIHNIFWNSLDAKNSSKNHVITSSIEHPAILHTLKEYEKKGLLSVSFLPVDKYGTISTDDVKKAINKNTALITIMAANNEIGTIQPINEIGEIAKENNIYFHTDAVQAAGKISLNVKEINADFLTISGHKIYAPKGIGVLYVKKGIKINPLVYGGHHEKSRRAGTENTIGIIALGKAVEVVGQEMEEENKKLLFLKEKLKKGLLDNIPDIIINGHPENSLPNTLNVSFKYIEGESILLYSDLEGIAVSTGSACSTGSLEPSHVIMALEPDPERAHSSIRFSLGRENTKEDIDYVIEKLPPIIKNLRNMSPLNKNY
ncbi:MAG: IscS subfamily cysteine desulfurase [Bacteroidales bacterium]|nr:IscS subfamily cysteine desulfurase [Bacteroidales bacterium]